MVRDSRKKRAAKTRHRISVLRAYRLCVHKTSKHMYAQVISPNGDQVVACASTLDKQLKAQIKYSGNAEAASLVGKLVAERALSAGVDKVAFDRSGFPFHGRVAALAQAARDAGIQF